MPTSTFTANKGLTYPLVENADDTGAEVGSVVYTTSDASILQLNAAGFVTAGGNTMSGQSFTALANGSATITGKGDDAEGDEVDAELDVTVSTVESGTIVPGGGLA